VETCGTAVNSKKALLDWKTRVRREEEKKEALGMQFKYGGTEDGHTHTHTHIHKGNIQGIRWTHAHTHTHTLILSFPIPPSLPDDTLHAHPRNKTRK